MAAPLARLEGQVKLWEERRLKSNGRRPTSWPRSRFMATALSPIRRCASVSALSKRSWSVAEKLARSRSPKKSKAL